MTLHIGIVGCSAEGAALCYRTICTEGPALMGPYVHPELTMHTPPLAAYIACLERNDMAGVGDLMLASATILARAGADLLICPDNTIHQAWKHVAPRAPLPWLHIAEVVADEAQARGFECLALSGTRWLTESEVYPAILGKRGIACQRPTPDEIAEIDRIIMDELVHGVVRAASRDRLAGIVARLMDGGSEAVILGCTELPLILDDAASPLPVLDSTRLLARAALRRAVEAHSGGVADSGTER